MNKMSINLLALAIGLAFSTCAPAQTLPPDPVGGDGSVVEHSAARHEPRAQFKPEEKVLYKLRVDSANADYSEAREKCAEQAGDGRGACVKEAKAEATAAKADAKLQMKTALAHEKAAAAK